MVFCLAGKPHTCDSPAKVFNVTVMHPNQDVFENGDMLKYVCAELYMQAALEFMTCLYGIWSPAPDCDDILTVLGMFFCSLSFHKLREE